MKKHILQIVELSPKLDAQLDAEFHVHRLWQQADSVAYLQDNKDQIEGIATCAPVGAGEELISQLPALKVIASRGVGLEKVALEQAQNKGIQVSATPNVLTDCVADLGVALMLDVTRRISAADRFVRRNDWLAQKYPMTTDFNGKKLGIVGLGQIGRAVAARMAGFNMCIRYVDRAALDDVPYEFSPSLEELAAWADIMIVTVSGGPGSRHLISSEIIEALGPQGFLVNISRGTVIDQDALVTALKNKTLGGAGLDVFADEPQVPDELKTLENVVLTPHMASGTVETREKMEDLVFANLKAFFADGKVLTPAF